MPLFSLARCMVEERRARHSATALLLEPLPETPRDGTSGKREPVGRHRNAASVAIMRVLGKRLVVEANA